MTSNIFLEYNKFIKDLKEKISLLQRKFNVCRDILNYDYSNGEVYEDEYQFLRKLTITDYREDIDKRYELSLDEVKFLKENAQVLKDGSIAPSLVKEDFLKKKSLLDMIFESVRIHYFFNSFDDFTRKEKFSDEVLKYYDNLISSLENELVILGKDDSEKRQKVELLKMKKNRYIDRIFLSSRETFEALIDEFYGVNVFYYNWYRKCEIKQESENGFIYKEHVKSSTELNDSIIVSDGLIREYQILQDERNNLANNLAMFLANIMNLDFSEFYKQSIFEKIAILFNKNNKPLLHTLFGELSKVDGILAFYKKLAGEHSIIKIQECFEKYFSQEYGEDTKYVDVSEFLRNLIADVIDFYRDEMKKLDDIITIKQIEINSKKEKIKQMSAWVKDGAKLQRDIFKFSEDGTVYKLVGLTDEEEEQVFLDMKEYLVTNLTDTLEIKSDFDVSIKKKVTV